MGRRQRQSLFNKKTGRGKRQFAMHGPFRFAAVFTFSRKLSFMGVPIADSRSPRQIPGRSAARGGTLKNVLKPLFLLDTFVNSQKKLASRLDEMTGRCLTLERNQRFFKNSQMYCVKTVLIRFEHSFIKFFSKEQFYRFFKDVLNKTLTFEVPNLPKMEAENYLKIVIIRRIKIF